MANPSKVEREASGISCGALMLVARVRPRDDSRGDEIGLEGKTMEAIVLRAEVSEIMRE